MLGDLAILAWSFGFAGRIVGLLPACLERPLERLERVFDCVVAEPVADEEPSAVESTVFSPSARPGASMRWTSGTCIRLEVKTGTEISRSVTSSAAGGQRSR